MFKPLWQEFPVLVEMVREDHRNKSALVGGGHSFEHAFMVAQYGQQISEGREEILVWVAGICHNTDRHYGDDAVERMMAKYLDKTHFSKQECQLVTEAVLNHSHRPSDKDNPITIPLMDADKLGNLGWQVIARAGQFRPDIPVMNFKYLGEYPPGCDFRKPGSIYRDMLGVLEWAEPGWIRSQKARELAAPMFEDIRRFVGGLYWQYRNVGLIPYPWPDDFEALKG